jgi:hypothetical protein
VNYLTEFVKFPSLYKTIKKLGSAIIGEVEGFDKTKIPALKLLKPIFI